jgi:hypothetical protein
MPSVIGAHDQPLGERLALSVERSSGLVFGVGVQRAV